MEIHTFTSENFERSRSLRNRGPRLEKNVKLNTIEKTMRVNVCPAVLRLTVICIGDLL